MDISMFETRTMLQALEQLHPPKTFLLDTFFPTVETSDSEYVDIDIYKGKRRLAPFVNPARQGKVVEALGYTTRSYKPPYIKMKMPTTAAEIMSRTMGNHIYQDGQSPSERAATRAMRDMQELREMIVRREEWMAAQALDGGQIAVEGEGVSDVLDFQMEDANKIVLSGTSQWDGADADIGADIRNARRVVGKQSGIVPTDFVLGEQAYDALIKNPALLEQLDNRRVNTGQIDLAAYSAMGASYVGNLFGADLWTYDEWYTGDDGEEKPMVPVNKVFAGSRQARTARHYGAIKDLSAIASVPYYPKSWEEEDPSVRWMMLQSAPLVVPHQIDAFATITVVSE
jgi:hypothetical protein